MYFLQLFKYPLFFILLCLLSSCNKKTKEETTYGSLRIVNTKTEQPYFFWQGSHFIGMDSEAYYKDHKIDFTDLAKETLTGIYQMKGKVHLMEIRPSFLQANTLFYCKLSSEDKMTLCFLTDDGDKLSLVPVVEQTQKAPLPILQEIDSIDRTRVLFANYVINEQRQQVEKALPVIDRYYKTAQNDSTNFEGYVNTLYGVSPDQKVIVRSFYPHMMDAHPQLITLFLTELTTGKTTEFPLQVKGKNIVKLFNEYISSDETTREWFQRSFKWVLKNGEYTIEVSQKPKKES